MASARPPFPVEVWTPSGAGQEGGVARGPSSNREGAGKGRGARRMCGSACLPGGGAASPALPLTANLRGDLALGYPHPGRPREVRGGAGCALRALPDWPVRRGFGSGDPPALREPHPQVPTGFQAPRRQRPPSAQQLGDSQGGGQCREVPRPLRFLEAPTWKLSHGRTPSPLPLAVRDPRRTPTQLRRNTHSGFPELGLQPLESAPEPSQPQAGSYLSSWRSW